MKLGFSPIQGGNHFDDALRQVAYADEHGLDSVYLQEHHEELTAYWPDPLTVLAGFATGTERIHLGTAIMLLPLYNPVRAAERIATVDGLSDGRLHFGAGLGHRDREFDLLNVPKQQRGARYAEYVRIVARLLSEETVTYDGEYYQLEKARCAPRPAGNTRPPIWIGGYHEKMLQRAAEFLEDDLADGWLPGTQLTIDELESRQTRFDEIRAERGLGSDPELVVLRNGIVAPTTEQARDLAHEYLLPGFEQHNIDTDDPEELIRSRFIVGDPGEWIRQLEEYEDRLGVDHVIARIHYRGMDHDQVMEQLELLASEVHPELTGD